MSAGRRRGGKRWLIWLLALPLAAVLIIPSAMKLYESKQPVPVPDETWSMTAEEVELIPAPADWTPPGGKFEPHTTYVPALDIVLPFHDAGATNGWLDVERNTIDSGVRFKGAGAYTQGSTVVAAHVNNSRLGKGPFAKLVDVEPGMEMIVTDAGATPYRFKATSLDYYLKEELPAQIWAVDGPSELTLITCGGGLVRQSDGLLHYASNVVARGTAIDPKVAVPLPGLTAQAPPG